jgi:hypothetical protein
VPAPVRRLAEVVQYVTFSRDKADGSGSELAVVRVELSRR